MVTDRSGTRRRAGVRPRTAVGAPLGVYEFCVDLIVGLNNHKSGVIVVNLQISDIADLVLGSVW